MKYRYEQPERVREISGHRFGRIDVAESQLEQTHDELLNRLGVPHKTIAVHVEIEASRETVWQVAAGSVSCFFSHQPSYCGVTALNALGSEEGGRYIVYRMIVGAIFERVGEVLVNMPLSQFTASDVDVVDPGVSGCFPSLYSIRLFDHAEDPNRTILLVSCTSIGVAHPWAAEIVSYQANSIRKQAEILSGRE
jgi:hypothetical protein